MEKFIGELAESTGHEAVEIGKDVLKAGANLIGPLAIAGLVVVGLGKMFEGLRRE